MEENKEEKIVVTMHKQLLSSERAELKKKRLRNFLILLSVVFGVAISMVSGYYLYTLINRTYEIKSSDVLGELEYIMDNYWLYGNEHENLVDELENKAFYGMTAMEEDPYTTYMSADEMKSFSTNINMDYVGIGLQYTNYDGKFQVTEVFKNSPAKRAGVKIGDIITKIDGMDISDLDTDAIKALILGEAGTEVVVTFVRGSEELDIAITRGVVDSSVYCYAKDDVVIMELNSFGYETGNSIDSYLQDFTDYHKIIIDLRNNTGGYQASVATIAGLFIGDDKVYMYQVDKDGNEKADYTDIDRVYDNFTDIVILTNGNTASAAEVLTICLKEQHPNTITVGETTFGKGVVQSTYHLVNGSVLKVTSSKWLSPNKLWINKVGIKPDYEVKQPDIMYAYFYAMEEGTSYEYDSVSECNIVASLCLDVLGYDVDRFDGYFDETMKEAIYQFKKDNNLALNYVLDVQTYDELCSKAIHIASTDIQFDTQLLKALELLADK